MLKALWKDPVWAAVIATGITALLGVVGTYVLGLWPAISNWASDAWKFITVSTPVSNWILGVLGLCTALAILAVVAGVWTSVSGRRSPLTSYTTDTFFGLRWRWIYMGGTIDRLHTFCPKCDFQVFPLNASSYRAVDRIAFRCDGCGEELGSFDENYESLESKATRLVQLKLRKGTWSEASGA